MHQNEALARREIELINAGAFDEVAKLYTADFVFHYPGKNPLAGTYRSYGDFADKAQALFKGGTLQRVLHDAFGSDDHAVQMLEVTAEASGRTHSWRGIAVGHVRDGKFSEMWILIDDQYGLDEFLNSLAGS